MSAARRRASHKKDHCLPPYPDQRRGHAVAGSTGDVNPRLPDMVLFTISNTRGPLHEEQDTRVSLTALRTTKRLDPWWSQTGSNRRPHACKARALPTELWPHGDETTAIRSRMVGLGRLERPTSPLSGVRSNHLSYRPDPRYGTKTGRQRKLQAPSSESRGQAQKSPSSAP